MDKQSDDTAETAETAGLDRLRAIYGIDAAGCRTKRAPEKPKGSWKQAEAERPTIAPSMTLQGIEVEAQFLGLDPFSAVAGFLAAVRLGRGTRGSRPRGLLAPY